MDVFNSVKRIICEELNIAESKVTLDANLKDDLGADSLDAIEVIMSLEEEFNISIDDDAAQGITTVKDIVDYIEKNI